MRSMLAMASPPSLVAVACSGVLGGSGVCGDGKLPPEEYIAVPGTAEELTNPWLEPAL
jgi:hypothetical protein